MKGFACRRRGLGPNNDLLVRVPYLFWYGPVYLAYTDEIATGWHIRWLCLRFSYSTYRSLKNG